MEPPVRKHGATLQTISFCTNSLGCIYAPNDANTFKEAENESHYLKALKEYINPRLLILDEWLMNSITNAEARYVLDLIHKRRRKSSTIFCSQYEDSGWYAQLGGDETPLADSIMDRIAYDSYKINIRAKDPKNDRSMREVYGIRPEERQ